MPEESKFGLKTKLIISMMIVGVLPLFLVGTFSYLQGNKSLQEILGSNFQALAQEMSAQIDFLTEEEIAKNFNAAKHPVIVKAVSDQNALLQTMTETEEPKWIGEGALLWEQEGVPLNTSAYDTVYPILQFFWKENTRSFDSTQALFVTDSQGLLVASINTNPDFELGAELRITLNGMFAQGKPYIGQLYLDKKTNQHVIHIAVPVLSETGVIGAFHRIYSAKNYYSPVLEPVRFGNTGHIMLIDSRGIVIDCPVLPTGHQLPEDFAKQAISATPGWSPTNGDGHGNNDFSLIGHAPLNVANEILRDSSPLLYTIAWQSSDELFDPMHKLIHWSGAIGVGAILLILSLGTYASNKIVKPIRSLKDAVVRIGKGFLEERVPVSDRDEIGELATTFNTMVGDLQTSRISAQKHMQQMQETLSQLTDRESQINAIMNNIAEGIVAIDDTGDIKLSNSMMEKLFGYTSSELSHMNIANLLPEMYGATNQDSQSIMEDRSSGEVAGRRKNGSSFPLEVIFGEMRMGEGLLYVVSLRDITERKRMDSEIRKMFRAIEQSPSSVLITDREGRIEYVNPIFIKTSGFSMEEVIGKTPRILKSNYHSHAFYEKLWSILLSGKEWRGEFCNKKKDGELIWELQSISPLKNADGEITHFVAVKIDDTERKRAEKKLQRFAVELQQSVKAKDELIGDLNAMKEKLEISAKTDPLTRLPNRRGLLEKADYEIHRFERSKKPMSIILCDIDYFKKVNDTFGHDAGDLVLVEVAKTLTKVSRKQDIPCRWGGEEFLILLPETDLKGAAFHAEKLRTAIEATNIVYADNKLQVTMSFGLSLYDTEGAPIDQHVKQADECLYEAKRTGRNKVVLPSDEA